jgi:hypothetical protein
VYRHLRGGSPRIAVCTRLYTGGRATNQYRDKKHQHLYGIPIDVDRYGKYPVSIQMFCVNRLSESGPQGLTEGLA